MPSDLTPLGNMPAFILAGYLLLLLVFGIMGYLKSRNSEEDYYLAGRGQGWLVSSLTIMATFFSSFALLGAPGMVYRDGVVFALFSLNVPLAGACVYVLGARIRRIGQAKGYVTPADMIADYYDNSKALRLLVALVGVLYTVPYVVMQIQAGGILSQQMFPGEHSFEIGAIILALITMVYIMIGGMRSVAWTDVVQGILLMGGMLVGGFAAVAILGGPAGFLEAIAQLPAKSLSVPGTTGRWSPEVLFTVCVFGAIGSMIQPAQWMRYYSAKSSNTLRRSALIFAVCLTACFMFGVILVGLGGQAIYPLVDDAGAYRTSETGRLLPHPQVGETSRDFDQILVVVLKNHLPELLGPAGAIIASLIFIAIMAAAMSTSDSNLHAMSALLTRDIYDRFIRPNASQKERTWIGRVTITMATLGALALVLIARHSARFDPLGMIAALALFAIAFSTQLIPVTVDILFTRKGTRPGATLGLLSGLAVTFLFSPLVPTSGQFADMLRHMARIIDVGAWGLIVNVTVFAIVSTFTQAPSQENIEEFRRLTKS